MVVTTHLNTENIHNHIVVNSVSFRTGLKFKNHISDHIKLREISDDVCREFNKSVLENAKFYKSDKKLYWMKKNGKLSLIHKKPSLMKLLGNEFKNFARADGEILQRAEKVFFQAWCIVPIVAQSYISVLQRA